MQLLQVSPLIPRAYDIWKSGTRIKNFNLEISVWIQPSLLLGQVRTFIITTALTLTSVLYKHDLLESTGHFILFLK